MKLCLVTSSIVYPFPPKYVIVREVRGSPICFGGWNLNIFGDLGAHAKFWNLAAFFLVEKSNYHNKEDNNVVVIGIPMSILSAVANGGNGSSLEYQHKEFLTLCRHFFEKLKTQQQT